MLALRVISLLKRHVSESFPIFKAFFSQVCFMKWCVSLSLSYNSLSFFLLLSLFHFWGPLVVVVQLQGEELKKLETRL